MHKPGGFAYFKILSYLVRSGHQRPKKYRIYGIFFFCFLWYLLRILQSFYPIIEKFSGIEGGIVV